MSAITEDQEAVYDRQIRVWGIEAQKRLTDAKLLIIGGSMLVAEVAKNTVLAGIGNIGLYDAGASRSPENFLITADAEDNVSVAEASVRTLKEMNPMIQIQVESVPEEGISDPATASTVSSREALGAMIARYDIVVAEVDSFARLAELDEISTSLGKKIFAGVVRGQAGFFFINLQTHEWFEKASTSSSASSKSAGEAALEMIIKRKHYPTLSKAMKTPLKRMGRRLHRLIPIAKASYHFERTKGSPVTLADAAAIASLIAEDSPYPPNTSINADDDLLRSFLGAEPTLAPVHVILGGIIANGVIQVIAGKEAPLSNTIVYSLFNGAGGVFELNGAN